MLGISLMAQAPFPILSDSAGRFPAIWADESAVFDVTWSDQVFDKPIATFSNIQPLADAVLASVALADMAADAAADARDAAILAQAGAEAARDQAEQIVTDLGTLAQAVADAEAAKVDAEAASVIAVAAAAEAVEAAESVDAPAINARLDALDLAARRRRLIYGDLI